MDVQWNLSKNGFWKPRVNVEKAEIDGNVIEWVTGFNAKYIQDNKIGVGAMIMLVRSGDVIPQIMHVVRPAMEAKMPPGEWVWTDTMVDARIVGDELDTNPDVIAKLMIAMFTKLEVDGAGPGLVKVLVKHGWTNIERLITLTPEEMIQADGIQMKTATRFTNGFRSALANSPLATLMASSNIMGRGIGTRKLDMLFDAFPQFMDVGIGKDEKISQVTVVEGFGGKTAIKLVENIPEMRRFLDLVRPDWEVKVASLVNSAAAPDVATAPAAPAINVVFTKCRPSKELVMRMTAIGHVSVDRVAKSVSIVVISDEDGAGKSSEAINGLSGKTKSAAKLGIRIMMLSDYEVGVFL
jgi:NAD-dependent DNA ligase